MAGFKNAKRVGRRLRAIPPGVRKQVRARLRANAAELVVSQRGFAPVEDGDLRASIRFSDTSNANRIAMTVEAGGARTTKAIGSRTYDSEVNINSGDTRGRKKLAGGKSVTYDYALGQEFGTEDMTANPFFFPPYRAKKKAFKRTRNKAAKAAIGAAVAKP